jgi:hypothetical protein
MARLRRAVIAAVTAAFTIVGTGVAAITSLSNRTPTDRRRGMRFTGRRLPTALALATLCVGIGSTSAMAQPPAWETITVDETYLLPITSATCGFEVYKHDFGTLEIQTIELSDGTFRIHDVAVRIDSVISAPSTGQSLLVHPGGPGGRNVTLHPDGSITYLAHGTDGMSTVEGAGLVYASSGMHRIETDASGNVTEVEHGLHSENYSALCPTLAG